MYIPAAAMPAVAVPITFTLLSFIIVSSRIFTRTLLIKTIGLEDFCMIIAMAASIAFMALVIIQVKSGLGRAISFEELSPFLKAVWATELAYNFSLSFCKFSIIIQCLRIFRTSTTRKVLYGFLIFSIIFTIWTILSNILNCIPPQAAWDLTVKGRCLNPQALGYANAGVTIFSDICTLLIPIPQLKALQIPKKQRIVLITVFSCGAFACITSIIRLYSYQIVSSAPHELESIKAVDIAVWSCIEINLGIICASVPTLKPLAAKVIPKLLTSGLYHSSGRAYHTFGTTTQTKVTGDYSKHTRPRDSQLGETQKVPNNTTILVEQSIELTTMAVNSADNLDAVSEDGSQNELVDGNGWHSARLEGAGNQWDMSKPRNDQ